MLVWGARPWIVIGIGKENRREERVSGVVRWRGFSLVHSSLLSPRHCMYSLVFSVCLSYWLLVSLIYSIFWPISAVDPYCLFRVSGHLCSIEFLGPAFNFLVRLSCARQVRAPSTDSPLSFIHFEPSQAYIAHISFFSVSPCVSRFSPLCSMTPDPERRKQSPSKDIILSHFLPLYT